MRVRWSQERWRRERYVEGQLISIFRKAMTEHTPCCEAFAACIDLIGESDLTVTQKRDLTARAWALRDWLWATEATWQLYVDGIPLTSNEISDRRAAGDENIWLRVKGRHEWRGTHEPFASGEGE
jgi:hypothetical protein